MPCSQISADWAAQRIKDLDLRAAVLHAFLGAHVRGDGTPITTLIERFQYPRHGPGQMWRRCAELLRERGSEVVLGAPVRRVRHDGRRVLSVTVEPAGRASSEVRGQQFLCSMPIRDLLAALDPPPPPAVQQAAQRLRYRDFLTVALVIDRAQLFPDNWIYIHSPDVRVGRIQNFKNWSPDMVPDRRKTALGLEYFVQEGDELWSLSDAELVALATREVEALELVPASAVEDGTVLRVKKAYPVYDDEYQAALRTVRGWLESLGNLQLVGRNGQHRYNNQDHSMMTGVLAARNVTGGHFDVWSVNVEQEYHEEKRAAASRPAAQRPTAQRLVPRRAEEAGLQALIDSTFARYDQLALGAAVGLVAGVGLFLATAVLLLRNGGGPVGPNLSLLGAYLFGYTVTWWGALLGLIEAGALGFGFGWIMAWLINRLVAREQRLLWQRIEGMRAMDLFEGAER